MTADTAIAPLNFAHYGDEVEEADAIATQIKTLRDAGVPGASIAVLIRTNRQTRALESSFARAGFTFRIIGAPSFWSRYQTQAITSYLKVLIGVGSKIGEEALATAISTPARFIGAKTCWAAAQASPNDPFRGLATCRIYPKQKANYEAFAALITKYRAQVGQVPVIDLIRDIVEESGVAGWLRDQAGVDDDTPETNGDGSIGIVDDVAVAGAEWGNDLAGFVSWIMDQEAVTGKASDLRGENENDAVTVLSIHRSKGLEWPVVFVAGCSDGLLPHALAKTAQEQEEERRMAYVAFTRAEEALFVSSTSLYSGKPAGISPFIVEAGLVSEDEVEEVTAF